MNAEERRAMAGEATTEIVVKIADMAVAREPAVMSTHGLGSCLAIALYDAQAKVGGLAHVMLPSPELTRNQSNPAKFPATAINAMLERMEMMGASRSRIRAKLAGGARMFGSLLASRQGGNTTNIGQRNVQEAKAELGRLGIPIVAEDTGSDYGRSVEFLTSTGTLLVRSFRAGLKEL
jgi:chemotaxis protein CheD